jgi:putative ABC transport system substrate-binding protein
MRRRDFITLLGGAAAAWPLAARAQQPALPVIGFVNPGSPEGNALYAASFRQGLGEIGYAEGRNLSILYRWLEGQLDRLPAVMEELVRQRVAVIAVPGNTTAALAAKAATASIPIVFGVNEDPVGLGLVASLARPGGNVTGVNFFANELVPKRVGFLREMVPRATWLALLVNPANGLTTDNTLKAAQAAAHAMNLETQVLTARTSEEIETALASLAGRPDQMLFVGPDGFYTSRRVQLATLTARHGIPATFGNREYVEVGGLMSYGASVTAAFRQAGVYTGQILKGAKPADLPVVQSTKFELVLNAVTARALGLQIPPSMLAIADEVIE